MIPSEAKAEKRKKLIFRMIIIFLTVIAFLTFFSNTINNFLLPQVNVSVIKKGSLKRSVEKSGKIEMLNKKEVYANGAWKVKDVFVKKNQKIKKGAVMASVEEEDALLELNNKQLEVIKLEDELGKCIGEFGNSTVKGLEEGLEAAGKSLEKAEANLKALEERYNAGIGLETKDSFEKAQKEYDDALYDYNEKLRNLDKIKQENGMDIKERKLELDIKKLELEKLKKNIPSNGRIVSDCDGTVLEMNIGKGGNTVPDKPAFIIGQDDSKYRVTWTMDMSESDFFDLGNQINISLKVRLSEKKEGEEVQTVKDMVLTEGIDGKEYLADEKQYKYWADIEITQGEAVEGQDIEITALKESKIYGMVIPGNCITEKNGKHGIFVLKERMGAFGEEKYVEEEDVNILDEDGSLCAISAAIGDDVQIVENSTKPLQDGMQVRLR